MTPSRARDGPADSVAVDGPKRVKLENARNFVQKVPCLDERHEGSSNENVVPMTGTAERPKFVGTPLRPVSASSADPMARDERKFSGAPSQAIYTVELCAGSAGVTCRLMKAGFAGIPVDHVMDRHSQETPCLMLNLANPSSWTVLEDLLVSGRLLYVHAAPPCGTAIKARERPLPQWMKDQWLVEPRPLRSDRFPEGLPSLSGLDKLKVEQANAIYELTADFLVKCVNATVGVSVENPTDSYTWRTS